MVKTSTQRMQELRARKRQMKRDEELALAPTTYFNPFSTYLERTGGVGLAVHHLMLGNKWWDFSSDDGIEPLAEDALEDEDKQRAANSLGKAEFLLDVLEDIATTLAARLNEYKRKEIGDRIQDIEASDLSDPTTKKKALSDIVRLQKMLDQLDKQVRWTLPEWKVIGE